MFTVDITAPSRVDRFLASIFAARPKFKSIAEYDGVIDAAAREYLGESSPPEPVKQAYLFEGVEENWYKLKIFELKHQIDLVDGYDSNEADLAAALIEVAQYEIALTAFDNRTATDDPSDDIRSAIVGRLDAARDLVQRKKGSVENLARLRASLNEWEDKLRALRESEAAQAEGANVHGSRFAQWRWSLWIVRNLTAVRSAAEKMA